MQTTKKKHPFLVPKTSSGRHSVELILIFVITYCLFQLLVISGQRGGDTIFDNLLLLIPALSMALAGIASFLFGIISIVLKKERSFPVFVSTAAGFLVLIFIMGEILYPH